MNSINLTLVSGTDRQICPEAHCLGPRGSAESRCTLFGTTRLRRVPRLTVWDHEAPPSPDGHCLGPRGSAESRGSLFGTTRLRRVPRITVWDNEAPPSPEGHCLGPRGSAESRGSLFGTTRLRRVMLNCVLIDPRDRFVCPYLTLLTDRFFFLHTFLCQRLNFTLKYAAHSRQPFCFDVIF